MTHSHAGLLLDMGLGKTVVTLTVLHRLLYDEFALNKALVIAPKRVAEDTWSREAEKWDHLSDLRVVKVLGSAKQREAALRQDGDVYVINRENVVWLVETLGSHWPFDGIVIDELSSFKSSRSKRWRALRRVIGCANYVYGLTGTPAPGGYIDLWPEMYLLDRGQRLGRTLGEYRNTYFNPGAHKGHIVYEWRLKRGAKERIDAKLEALEELADTNQGQPLLVFYTYKHDLSRIQARFPGAVQIRDSETIRDWNDGRIPMLLCHPASAGHGLNLQAGGHIIVWFGLPWSLELYQQANDRLHRMGQTQGVIVHHLVAQGTLDERVMSVLAGKQATQKSLLDALKSYVEEELA